MHSPHRLLSKLFAGVPYYDGLSYHERPLPAAATLIPHTAEPMADFQLEAEAPQHDVKQCDGATRPPL